MAGGIHLNSVGPGRNMTAPVIVTKPCVEMVVGSFTWLHDTTRPDGELFTIGRKFGVTGEHTLVVLPSAALVSSWGTQPAYEDAVSFLQVWEDWEVENNGDAYGSYLRLTKGGWQNVLNLKEVEASAVELARHGSARYGHLGVTDMVRQLIKQDTNKRKKFPLPTKEDFEKWQKWRKEHPSVEDEDGNQGRAAMVCEGNGS
jgi:hypothetical protein